MSFLIELLDFVKLRKKYWLVPVLLIMLLVGLVVMLQATALAPFIYTFF